MKSCTKKIFALLLAVIMVICLLTGCGEKKSDAAASDGASTSAPAGKPDETSNNTPAETKNSEHPHWLCDEKTTLTVTTYDGVNATFEAPSNDDPFWQWMEDETNVHIEWDIIPYAGFNEVIQTRLASGSGLSDIITVYTSGNLDTALNAGENGVLLDMAPYWDTHLTNIKAYCENTNPAYKNLITTGNGEIFAINSVQQPSEGHILLIYNTAWMDELNLEIPDTLDEFTAVLKAMKEAGDLNGNGKDDEIILTAADISTLNNIIGNAFGLEEYNRWDSFQVDENGKVWFEGTSDNMKAMLSYENELYEAGILDAEIASMDANMMSEKIAADRVGVFVYYSSFAQQYGCLTTAGQADPDGEHYTLGHPLASEWNGNHGYFVQWDCASGNPTGVYAQSKNAELAMRWLDFLFANEDAVIRRTLGVEGKDYKRNADGSIEVIYPTDGTVWAGSGNNRGQLSLPYQQTANQMLVTKYRWKWYLDEYEWLRQNCEFKKAQVAAVNYYTNEERAIVDTWKADFTAYLNEMKAKFITGEADIDTDWESFLKNAEKLGLNELTEAYQSVYERTKES